MKLTFTKSGMYTLYMLTVRDKCMYAALLKCVSTTAELTYSYAWVSSYLL